MQHFHLLILIILSIELLSSSASPGPLPQRKVKCSAYRIPNGLYSMRRRDTILRITCQHGYVLFGTKSVECINGRWDGETPVCAKKGCSKKPNTPKDGFIQMEEELKATLFCRDNYKIAGGRVTYCNGTDWDRPLGTCREIKTTIQLGCDFESDDVCGWVYDEYGSVSWKRAMAANMFLTLRTGPQHDHTTMTANGGHYMLMESFTPRRDATAQLISPIYPRELSLRTACCFRFYYFMYGATVGALNIYVRPISVDIATVMDDRKYLYFTKIGNQNNIWNEGIFDIEEMSDDFQIIFVGTSGNSHLSDIAIDDVKLMTGVECRPGPETPVHKEAVGVTKITNVEDETISSASPFELTSNVTNDGDAAIEKNSSNNNNNNNTRDESQAIYDVQTCEYRCTEPGPTGLGIMIKNGLYYKTCDCHPGCVESRTCCPNYHTICVLGDDSFASVMEAMQSSSPIHVNMGHLIPNITTNTTEQIVEKPSMPTTTETTTTTTAATTKTTTTTTTTTSAKKPITKLTTAMKKNKNSTAKTTTTAIRKISPTTSTMKATTKTPKTTKSTTSTPTTTKSTTTTTTTTPTTTTPTTTTTTTTTPTTTSTTPTTTSTTPTTTTTTVTLRTTKSTPSAKTTALPSDNQENNQPHQEKQHKQQSSKSIATPMHNEMPSTSVSSDLLENSMTTRTTEFFFSGQPTTMSTRSHHQVNNLTPPIIRKQIIWKIKTEKHLNANRRKSNSILLTIMAIISGIVLTAIVLGAIYHRYAREGSGNDSSNNINWNQNEEGCGSEGGAISTDTGGDMIAIGRRHSNNNNNNNNNHNHNNNNFIRSNIVRNRKTIWQKFLRQMFRRSTNNCDSDDSSYNSDFLDTASLIYSSHEDEILLHTPTGGGVPVSTL